MQVFVILTVQGRGSNPPVTCTRTLDTGDFPTTHQVFDHMRGEIVKTYGDGLRDTAVQHFSIQPDELEKPRGLDLATLVIT